MAKTFRQFSAVVIWAAIPSYLYKHVQLRPKLTRDFEKLRVTVNS